MNYSFDNNNVKNLLRIDMPATLTCSFQEIGRVGRHLKTLASENVVDVIVEAKGYMSFLNRALFSTMNLSHLKMYIFLNVNARTL